MEVKNNRLKPKRSKYLQQLIDSNLLREPVIRSVIRHLELPQGSRGLDVGCGSGAQTLLLAEAVRPTGHVVGIDINSEFIEYAQAEADKRNLSNQVTYQPGNMYKIPFEQDSFDWAWSMDCVVYNPSDPRSALKEMVQVVKPHGLIAILGWSSQALLPGYPHLEAHLNATKSGIAPFSVEKPPNSHFLRTLGVFHELGLVDTSAHTFVGSIYAPLSAEIHKALIGLFNMRWFDLQSELSQQDWELYERLIHPSSAEFILNKPDYYAFFTYSLFLGHVAC